jgi:hypothetical protein
MKTLHRLIRLGMVSSRVNALDTQDGAHFVLCDHEFSPLILDQDLIFYMSGYYLGRVCSRARYC